MNLKDVWGSGRGFIVVLFRHFLRGTEENYETLPA